jgi:NADPH:quinone reductase-like Zn-dependent oxidoreductase
MRGGSMRAVRFAEYGGPEVLRVDEVDEPHAGAGELRIAVRAAGVNAVDWKIRAGYMSEQMPLPLPFGTGLDAAGVVDEVGEGVTGVHVGDAVFGSGSATYAEYAVLTTWVLKPEGLSFEEAAGYPVPVGTAVRILNQLAVQPGQTILVSGAAGGVGSAVVQLAVARGATVVGTASERNQDHVRSMGATPTVYGGGFVDRVREIVPGNVDAAFDIAGAGVIPELIDLTGDPSRVLSIADYSAPDHGAAVAGSEGDAVAALTEAARLFTQGRFQIPVERTFTLDHASEAHAASAAGHVAGRYIITVG